MPISYLEEKYEIDGKVAIVTGLGQGIGKSIAMASAAEGAKVVTNNHKLGSQGGNSATVSAWEDSG